MQKEKEKEVRQRGMRSNEITWGTQNDDIEYYFVVYITYYFGKWCCHGVSSLIINEGLKTSEILLAKDIIVFE